MNRAKLIGFCFCLSLFGAASASAAEFGFSLSGGVGLWDGEWNTSVAAFSEDFGQNVSASLFPVGSAYVDASFKTKGPLVTSVAVGAGFWGGRLLSSGGTSPDRVSTVAGIGLDIVPSVGFRFPLGKAELGADVRLGLGLLVSPLWTIDAWSSTVASAAYYPDPVDLGYAYGGASLVYGLSLGDYALSFFLSGDIGLATFDSSSGTNTPLILSRAGVGVRLGRDFSKGGRFSR